MSISGSASTGIGAGTVDAGAPSLEDCYTNIFHITELTGLKWCCLASASDQSLHQQQQSRPISAADSLSAAAVPSSQRQSNGANNADASDDTVLRAYAQCVADGILCAWRRRQPPSAAAAYENPIPKANAAKELWLFWYSVDEPKHIEQFKAQGLAVLVHSETGDMDSPRVEFEYETRTLFFKALHTAIERRLLAEGFIRFGHWLCRPLDPASGGGGALSRDDRRALPRFVNAVRFHFFLHRDSLVCASLNVQRQPTILRLGKAQLRERTRAQPVILAPWSIRAKLVPGQHDLHRLIASCPWPPPSASVLPNNDHHPMGGRPSTSSQAAATDTVVSSIDDNNTDIKPPPISPLSAPRMDQKEASMRSTDCDNTDNNNGTTRTMATTILTMLEHQWTEWKRIYQNLADPTPSSQTADPHTQKYSTDPTTAVPPSAAPSPQTNNPSTTSRSTTNSAAAAFSGRSSGGSANSSSGDAAAEDNKEWQQHALPRLVLVEVNGHRMLYPSQFVAVLADELLPPRPKRASDEEEKGAQQQQKATTTTTGGHTTDEAAQMDDGEDEVSSNSIPTTAADSPQENASSGIAVLSSLLCRRRRTAAVGQCAARCSFEDALLLPRSGGGAATAMGGAAMGRQEQQQHPKITGRTLDEFNYDYARREFCYCRICNGGTKNAPSSATLTASTNGSTTTASTTVPPPGDNDPLAPTATATTITTTQTNVASAPVPPPLLSPRNIAIPPAPFHHRHTNNNSRSISSFVEPSSSSASLSLQSTAGAAVASALDVGAQVQAVHVGQPHLQQQQPQHKVSSSRKKTGPPLTGGKGSSSSKSNASTKSGGGDDATHAGYNQHLANKKQNRWAHGCSSATTAATTTSSSTTTMTTITDWPNVPEWDLLKHGSIFASRRKMQQQLMAAEKRAAEARQETAPLSGTSSVNNDKPRSAAVGTGPIDTSASALAELLMDEDDGMVTDGADGCDPIVHHPMQDLLFGPSLGSHHHPAGGGFGCAATPGMSMPSDAVNFLTQQRQRAATFGIVHQQLYHQQLQQQLIQQQQPFIKAEQSWKRRKMSSRGGGGAEAIWMDGRRKSSSGRRTSRKKPPSLRQLDTVSFAFQEEDSKLFTVDPFEAVPPLLLNTPNNDEDQQSIVQQKGDQQQQKQQQFHPIVPFQQHRQQQPIVVHHPILEQLLLSPAGGGVGGGGTILSLVSEADVTNTPVAIIPSTTTTVGDADDRHPDMDIVHVEHQQQCRLHHHQTGEQQPAAVVSPPSSSTSFVPQQQQQYIHQQVAQDVVLQQEDLHQQVGVMLPSDAESMPNAETPPALLDTSVAAAADGSASTEEQQIVADELLMVNKTRRTNNIDGMEQQQQAEEEERELIEEEEGRMMSMSSVDTSPASATSPATGPSSVGAPSGGALFSGGGDGSSSLAAHRMVPVAAELLMRGGSGGGVGPPSAGGEEHHHQSQAVQLNPHNMLSPPASNERIDATSVLAVGSANPQQQQQPHQHGAGGSSTTTAAATMAGTAASSSLIFSSQIPHDTLSRIYPTPPTPMQQFSPQNVLILSSHQQHQVYQQQQHVQAVYGPGVHHDGAASAGEDDDDEEQLQKATTKSLNILDTVVQLGDRLRRLTDETPLYDGVKARPIGMFGLFTGDLLNEQLSPEERVRQCCGGINGGIANASEKSEPMESKVKLMRELHDHLNQRRKRLAELCQESSSCASSLTTSVPLLSLAPAYTKRAKLAMAARLAADKADGDAGLDARLQELERLRFRGMATTTGSDEFLHHLPSVVGAATGANCQFVSPLAMHHQWAQWNSAGGGAAAHFPQHLPPGALPHSMLISQQQQQHRSILPPPLPVSQNFSPLQMFPPAGASLRMPSNVATMQMGQALHRLPTSLAGMMYQQQQQQQMMFRQQQLLAGVSSLSRSPSITALQQQPLLQRRSSALAMVSPSPSTAPTPAAVSSAAVSDTTAAPTSKAQSVVAAITHQPNKQSSSSSTIDASAIWNSLLQEGKVEARCSARLALLVQDTVADLHYDIVFDACPLCCCNSNIRSAELGIYIGAPRALLLRCDQLQRQQRQQQLMGSGGGAGAGGALSKQWSGFRIVPTAELQKCNCGFSAVRHRYLCGRDSGLFADDIAEAGGFLWPPLSQKQCHHRRHSFHPLFGRFNPANPSDRQFVDLLMHLCISQDMTALVRNSRRFALETVADNGSPPAAIVGQRMRSSLDYMQSPVDIYELNGVMNGILGLMTTTNTADAAGENHAGDVSGGGPSPSSILHPWGYQTADGVGEPRDVECLAMFEELKECFFRTAPPHAIASLTASAAAAPMIPSYSNGRRLEQLTLRSFARKGATGSSASGKETNGVGGVSSATAAAALATDADNGRAEPIPHVLVLSHAEREPILVSAQVLRDWDRLELMPADQCKDVLYLTVVPDVNVVVSKCKVYMDELSNMYERRCRLGIHVPIGIKEAPRDGILRVGREENANNSNNNISTLMNGTTPTAIAQQSLPSFPHSVHAMFMQFGPEIGDDMLLSLQRLRSFVEGCYAELCRFFLLNEKHLFERRAFHESAYRQQQQPAQGTSLATVPDNVAMPPPAPPSGGTGAILGTASFSAQSVPASATGSMPLHHHHHHTGGPGSSSGAVLHSPMAPHQQQTSPATGNNGPNSVPILHGSGGDGSSSIMGAGASTVSPSSSTSMAAALQRQTAEEMAQFEEKIAADLNVITGELENTTYLPHVVVCYLVNPFGMFGSDAAHRQFSVFASAVLLRMWNEFLQNMPPQRRSQLQLELLPIRTVYDYVAFVGGGSDCLGDAIVDPGCCAGDDGDDADFCGTFIRRERPSAQDELKRMAFSVFTQPRILRPQIALDAMSKSMTRFGSKERMKDIIQMFGDSPLFFKFNCNPFLLAPARSFPVSLLHTTFSMGLSSANPTAVSSASNTANSNHHNNSINNNRLPLLLCADGERVLFLAYCILPGDDWLCAAVTDERGTLLDTTLINLCPPAVTVTQPPAMGKEWRHRQRHSQIADALQRLWMFAQSVMLTQEVRNWRLVIGRMGKLGHGEFKQWTEILSKKNLKSRNNALKGKAPPEESGAVSAPCHSCAQSHGWAETPALLSACLVSTEPEPYLRVMASTWPGALGDNIGVGIGMAGFAAAGITSGAGGGVKPSGLGGGIGSSAGGGANTTSCANATSNKPALGSAGAGRQSAFGLSVGTQQQLWSQTAAACPEDRSITHIMVFQTILNVSLGHHPGEDLLQNAFDDDGDLTNVLGGFNFVEQNQEELDLDNLEIDKDEETQINNQPMAIGYTVSTAPLPPGMPSNFWHRCPAARRRAGTAGVAHLKSSLHINTSNLNEEYGSGTAAQQRERDSGAGATTVGGTIGSTKTSSSVDQQQQLPHAQHPLDAVATDDVLRYVLETYNALSWLSLDPVTGARRSCLPVHMQAIQRLHLAVNTFWGDAVGGGGQQPK